MPFPTQAMQNLRAHRLARAVKALAMWGEKRGFTGFLVADVMPSSQNGISSSAAARLGAGRSSEFMRSGRLNSLQSR